MTVDTEALIAAVRAGDIEAAQALLPVDPIVKRAREICARHHGMAGSFLRGECDSGPQMGGVLEALRAPAQLDADTMLRMARAVCYFASGRSDFLSGEKDASPSIEGALEVIRTVVFGGGK